MRLIFMFSTNLTRVIITFLICNTCFINSYEAQTASKKFKVVLDAGHGGKDSGNLGNGYYEKDIALNIVLQLGKILEKENNIEVIYTRKKDVFLELWERADIANEANANLFLSVHCNAHSSQARGTETFVMGLDGNARNIAIAKKENSVIFLEDNFEEKYESFDPNKPESLIGLELMQEEFLDQSIELASLIESEFVDGALRKSRGVKQNVFWVLHRSVMPSVLVETGFLTNKKEGAFLNSMKGQKNMAKAIARAVGSYKSKLGYDDLQKLDRTTRIEDEEAPQIFKNTTFKVQLAASKNDLALKSYNFKGLRSLSRKREGKLYKFFYGSTSDYTQAKRLLKEAQVKGYKSAFIVSFDKSNIQVPLKQVLN